MAEAGARCWMIVLNDLCDPGQHLRLPEPGFVHLYQPCQGARNRVSSDERSEQVFSVCLPSSI